MEPGWLQAYRGKTIAVTGANGFLGGQVVSRLAEAGCTIVRVTRTPPLSLPESAATLESVIGDVRNREVWDRVVNHADIVIHLAAQTSVATANDDPEADFAANTQPMRHLLDACRQQGRTPVILFAGTVTQSGVPSTWPVNEDAPDLPVTAYDQHKLMAERELTNGVSEGWVRGATLRLANVYGPGSSGKSHDRDVLNRMVKAAVRGEALTVFGAGEWVRDYLFVEDAVDAFLMAGLSPDRINGHHYVVGSGVGVTIRQAFELVAARVQAATGRHVPVITDDSTRPVSVIEQRHFVADSSRLKADTGWQPRWSLSDGIDRTIEAACA